MFYFIKSLFQEPRQKVKEPSAETLSVYFKLGQFLSRAKAKEPNKEPRQKNQIKSQGKRNL
jgi:hypothetical protein